MKWLSKILGDRGEPAADPIIAKCQTIAQEYGLSFDEDEWSQVLSRRDELAASPLAGAFVHRDVLHVLCFLCLFEGLFEAGVKLLRIGAYQRAIDTLEKARKLLPWPTVLYALGMACAKSGDMEAATKLRKAALEGFETRSSRMTTIVPGSLPDRDRFIGMMAEKLDTTGSLTLGLSGMANLRDAMCKEPW